MKMKNGLPEHGHAAESVLLKIPDKQPQCTTKSQINENSLNPRARYDKK